MLKAGQFKAPFGRQELTSSGNQQFVDRSIASVLFAPARQIGLQIGGQFGFGTAVPDMITYAGGIFNGNGINRTLERERQVRVHGPRHVLAVRQRRLLRVQPRALRASASRSRWTTTTTTRSSFRPTGDPVGVDVTSEVGHRHRHQGSGRSLPLRRVLLAHARQPRGRRDTVRPAPRRRPAGSSGTTSRSPAATRSPTSTRTRDDRNIEEWRGGLSWYFNKHFWKLQADYGVTRERSAERRGRASAAQEQGVPDSGAADVLTPSGERELYTNFKCTLHEIFTLTA